MWEAYFDLNQKFTSYKLTRTIIRMFSMKQSFLKSIFLDADFFLRDLFSPASPQKIAPSTNYNLRNARVQIVQNSEVYDFLNGIELYFMAIESKSRPGCPGSKNLDFSRNSGKIIEKTQKFLSRHSFWKTHVKSVK